MQMKKELYVPIRASEQKVMIEPLFWPPTFFSANQNLLAVPVAGPLQQTTWPRVPARPLELRKAALRFSTPCSPILYHDGLAIRQRPQGRVAWGGGVLKHSERHALRIPQGAAKIWKGCKEVWGALVVGHHQQHQMQWQSVFVLKRQQMSASEYNVPSSSSLASERSPFRNEVKI